MSRSSMARLALPQSLRAEFATVEAVRGSGGTTRNIDALLLCWIKYEKQLRRLFCFLVFQHPFVTKQNSESVVEVMVENRHLYPETFERGIKVLGVPDVPTLVGSDHAALVAEIERIKGYRHKLIHGQITGLNISAKRMEKDVLLLVRWIAALAEGAQERLGYDGIQRNTLRAAKAVKVITVSSYPFSDVSEFKRWLAEICNHGTRRSGGRAA